MQRLPIFLVCLSCFLPGAVLAQEIINIPLDYNTQRAGGGDYRNFESPSAEECARICAEDERCRAFDYSLNIRRCWLKDSTPAAEPNNNNISGVKPRKAPTRVRRDKGVGMKLEQGVQRTGGGDYMDFESPDAEDCARRCAEDPRCRAFDYSLNIRRCWLKDGSPVPSPNNNNISGVKN
ncbi:MAG TPA: hypothetical protein ENO11_05970 [Desulfobacteraceae bacterium]|nr:hypothetical protein [Desulfobacteraceae bacterium]